MTAEILCGIALGMFAMILLDLASRRREAGKAPERPAARDRHHTHHTVTISDPLLHDAELSFTFDTDPERKAFILGVEQGRDSTLTAMKLRKRIPTGYDLDFSTRAARPAGESHDA